MDLPSVLVRVKTVSKSTSRSCPILVTSAVLFVGKTAKWSPVEQRWDIEKHKYTHKNIQDYLCVWSNLLKVSFHNWITDKLYNVEEPEGADTLRLSSVADENFLLTQDEELL